MRSQRGVRRGALRQGQRAVERDREEIGRRLGGDWEGIGRGCQNHKGGASSTFCLKKWRLLHLFVSKSGVSSTFFSANLKVSGCEAEEGVEKGGEGGIEDGVAPEDVERRTQQILEPSADRSAR